jgi:aspartate aminotransferase
MNLQSGAREVCSPPDTNIAKSAFSDLPELPADEVFALAAAFAIDSHTKKVDLGAGVYRTEEGHPWPLPVVEKVEKTLHSANDDARHEYLSIAGDPRFLELARNLAFGLAASSNKSSEIHKVRIASIQTVSGTGANHIGAIFLAYHLNVNTVWMSDPTWANHNAIWDLPDIERKNYPYYDPSTRTFNFEEMVRTLETQAQENDVVLLHACAHNPTGLDPTKEEWKVIAEVCQRKKLFPFFDCAYQGFATGDPAEDSWAIRYFLNTPNGMEMCVAQSFSKNFGLYGQRTGAFHLVTNHRSVIDRDIVLGNLCQLIRKEYSMAPRYGSTIVRTILENETLTAEWLRNVQVISSRIKLMRVLLYNELQRLDTPGSWEHVKTQVCVFFSRAIAMVSHDT